jgi:uncharacterized protein with GYD domain
MPLFVVLYKLTDAGVKDIKTAPERIEQGIKAFEAMGGKLIGFYSTMGEYDYVSIGDAPSDEAALTFMLGLGAQGNVRSTSLKAFTVEQFTEAIKKLP